MTLLTQEIKRKLPRLYANDGKNPENVSVPLKLFDPCGRGTWYVTEFDGEDTMFGFCRSPLGPDCDELGYMALSELSAVKNRFGIGIERDLHWNGATLAQVINGERG